MVVDPSNSRLLHYSQRPLVPYQKRVLLPTSIFLDAPPGVDTWEVWSGTPPHPGQSGSGGYRDLGVDICEADVPALCTENFDYHDLRRHFLNGVLLSELLGKNIGVHLVGSDEKDSEVGTGSGMYVERVRDTRTYGDISNDVLTRWTFPLTPDLMALDGAQYELRKGNVYIAKDHVSLGRWDPSSLNMWNELMIRRTTVLDGPCLVGPRSALNEGAVLAGSTLGADCAVGPKTIITECHFFDNVIIGDHCVFEQSIIGQGARIGDGVVIERGCLIGDGVVLGKGVILPEFSRVGRERYVKDDAESDDDDEESEEDKARRLKILGPNSQGYLWPVEEEEHPEDSDSDDEQDPYEHPQNKTLLQLGRRLSLMSDSPESVSTLSAASSSTASTPLSIASSASLPDLPSLSLDAVPPEFHIEARASLERAYEEDHKVENAKLELSTLTMGFNAGIDRAREEVTSFLMSRIDYCGTPVTILASATEIWTRWGELAIGLSTDLTNIILDAQKYCVDEPDARASFGVVMRGLYDSDVVAEEDLVEWRSLSAAQGAGAKDEEEKEVWKELYGKGKAFVDVLEAMESDSDEEESEDEE